MEPHIHAGEIGAQLEQGMRAAAAAAKIAIRFYRIGSMFCGYLLIARSANLAEALSSDRERFARFFHGMLEAGVYLAPSQFEAGFLPPRIPPRTLRKLFSAARSVFSKL